MTVPSSLICISISLVAKQALGIVKLPFQKPATSCALLIHELIHRSTMSNTALFTIEKYVRNLFFKC
jgi:hypothetical protein